MPHVVVSCVVALVVLLAGLAHAHSPSQPPHQAYKIGDLKLESGETIKDFAISYVMHGKLNAKKSNAILVHLGAAGGQETEDVAPEADALLGRARVVAAVPRGIEHDRLAARLHHGD